MKSSDINSSDFIDVPISPPPNQAPPPVYTAYPKAPYHQLQPHPRFRFMVRSTRFAGLYIATNCFICFIFFGIFFLFSSIIQLASSIHFSNYNGNGINPLQIIGSCFLTFGILFLSVGIGGIVYAVKLAKKAKAAGPQQVSYNSTPIIIQGTGPVLSGGFMNGPSETSTPHLGLSHLSPGYGPAQTVHVPSQQANQLQTGQPQVNQNLTITPNEWGVFTVSGSK